MNNILNKTIIGILVMATFLSLSVGTSFAEEQRPLTGQQKLIALVNIVSAMKNIDTAIYMYNTDYKAYPSTSNKILGQYLKDNKNTRDMLASFDYTLSRDGKSYELSFNQYEWFKKANMNTIPKGYPRLLSKVGKVEIQPGVFDIKNVKL